MCKTKVQTNFYYDGVKKLEHEKNITRLLSKTQKKTQKQRLKERFKLNFQTRNKIRLHDSKTRT